MGRIPFPIGTCIDCGSKNKKLITKRCFDEPHFCYTKYQKAKYEAKQSGKEPKKKTAISPISKSMAEKLKVYRKVRDQYFKDNPVCEFPGCNSSQITLHHKRSREYFLCDTSIFMSVCLHHHNWIHDNDKESRKLGYLLSSI